MNNIIHWDTLKSYMEVNDQKEKVNPQSYIKEKFLTVKQLQVNCNELEYFTCSYKVYQFSDKSVSFALRADELYILKKYISKKIMIIGPSERCRQFYEKCPISWLDSSAKIEIHLTDGNLPTAISAYWIDKVKTRLSKMESLSNIVIGDYCLGTKSLMVNADNSVAFDDNRKTFMVYCKGLYPTVMDVQAIEREATTAVKFVILSNKNYVVRDIICYWFQFRGAQQIGFHSYILRENFGKTVLFFGDYTISNYTPLCLNLLHLLALVIFIFYSLFTLEVGFEIVLILALLFHLPLLKKIRDKLNARVCFESSII